MEVRWLEPYLKLELTTVRNFYKHETGDTVSFVSDQAPAAPDMTN